MKYFSSLLGQRLRALRLSNNLSQAELAARAGVSLMMLRRLESGGEGPLLALVKLLQALHASDVLASITDPPDATITTIAALEKRALVDRRQRASRLVVLRKPSREIRFRRDFPIALNTQSITHHIPRVIY